VGRARLANMAGRPVEYVSSWAGMEQRLLGLHRGHSALGDGDREALEVYGRKALSGDDLELFGRKPMEQQLLVWIPRLPRARAMAGKGRGGGTGCWMRLSLRATAQVSICQQCARPILSSMFAAHQEFCSGRRATQQQADAGTDPAKRRIAEAGFASAPATRESKRPAIEARRALRFVRTQDIERVTAQGTAPVRGLLDAHTLHRSFHFQLGAVGRGNDRTCARISCVHVLW
jgi:hypothetical protein